MAHIPIAMATSVEMIEEIRVAAEKLGKSATKLERVVDTFTVVEAQHRQERAAFIVERDRQRRELDEERQELARIRRQLEEQSPATTTAKRRSERQPATEVSAGKKQKRKK